MSLLKWGEFESHSGLKLPFKIDCDELDAGSIDCCANIIASKFKFHSVYGVPQGGLALANSLKVHLISSNIPVKAKSLLIVDDVLTTGNSLMEAYTKFKDKYDMINFAVIFNRSSIVALPGSLYSIFKV